MNKKRPSRPEGAAKPAQPAAKIYVIDSRERLLVPLTFGFCLLLVNTLLHLRQRPWLGTPPSAAWYVLLDGRLQGPAAAGSTGESRFLLADERWPWPCVSLALGSNRLLPVLEYPRPDWRCCPSTPSGLSGGQYLPGGGPPCFGSGSACCCAGLFGRPGGGGCRPCCRGKPGGSRRVLPLAAGTAGRGWRCWRVLVPVLASADALFAAATADLRDFCHPALHRRGVEGRGGRW